MNKSVLAVFLAACSWYLPGSAEEIDIFGAIVKSDRAAIDEFILLDRDVDRRLVTPAGEMTALKVAIYDREEELAVQLLQAGASLEETGVSLATVAGEGLTQLAVFLIRQNPDLAKEKNAIHAAVFSGYFDTVTALVNEFKRLNQDWEVGDPVASAIIAGHEDIARDLIDSGAKVTFQQLPLAIRDSSPGLVSLLLENGASPTLGLPDEIELDNRVPVDFVINRLKPSGQSSIKLAQAEIIAYYLHARGASRSVANPDPTLINQASQNGRLLLSNFQTGNNLALTNACKLGVYDSVQTIINAGQVDPHALSDAAKSALEEGHEDIVRLLINSGAELNEGVLHVAVRFSSPGIVRFLISKGAEVDGVYEELTPLETWWANGKGRTKEFRVLHELLSSGAHGCWLMEYIDSLPEFSQERVRYSGTGCTEKPNSAEKHIIESEQ